MEREPLVDFRGRIVMVGFGSTGQGTLPLLLRHVVGRDRVLVVAPDRADIEAARAEGVSTREVALAPDNYGALLVPELRPGDMVVNLSVGVSSCDLIALCQQRVALYLDTSVEPWHGTYTDASLPAATRTNYALREAALALRRPGARQPTALLTHGANPGLASHFVKQALLDIARDSGDAAEPPGDREGWARLAERLGVRVIHVAERDTQLPEPRKRPGEFVNTWSVDAFIDEALQPAELGWGSHERHFPADGAEHESGGRAAIYLNRPGASTRVRSWTPRGGPQHGFLITHAESISIAEYLTVGDALRPRYRPTVHYAYHPSDDAVLSLHELAGHDWRAPQTKRVVKDELVAGGRDELGVLLMGHRKGAYWYGSQLTLQEARRLAPHNSATTLQVAAGVLAGCIWAIRNPERDVVEPDQLPYDEILAIARPYLGEMLGAYSDWTPLNDREWLFSEPVDRSDPWQFLNFRVF